MGQGLILWHEKFGENYRSFVLKLDEQNGKMFICEGDKVLDNCRVFFTESVENGASEFDIETWRMTADAWLGLNVGGPGRVPEKP
jgi:hypothetical protein